ncbi:D-glucuronyl C5-epimerase family protein [Cupriavidus taiwanensis]|uniref:D-glucuronyl C5-epimerase family protein n=1 Tax=Cupriavidus taiwanensis TaxID=164546 RepID=UPI0018DDAEA9|nr:D-glucuronyl C5-epimerase family protein [Cupriavidus taiwanensis]
MADKEDLLLGLFAPPGLETKDFLEFHLRNQGAEFVSPRYQGPMAHNDKRDHSGTVDEYISPLYVGPMIIRQLLTARSSHDASLMNVAISELESLMKVFDDKGYWPRPAHAPLAAGWWSSMDYATVALALQVASELTGNMKFALDRDRVMENLFRSTQKKGGLLLLDTSKGTPDECWFLEYVWDGVDTNNAFFVQNGALYTLQAIKLLADATDRPQYKEKFECGARGYARMANSYYFKSGDWTYYQLRPKTIIEPHYMIIEIQLLQSLYSMSGKQVFLEALERRRDIMRKSYRVFATDTFDGEGKAITKYLFSRIGSPHPYYVDLYRNRIRFSDAAGKMVGYKESEMRGTIRQGAAFLQGRVPPTAAQYEVWADPSGRVRLFDGPLIRVSNDAFSRQPERPNVRLEGLYDADALGGDVFVVRPPKNADTQNLGNWINNRGAISIHLQQPLSRKASPLFAVKVFSEVDAPMRLVVFDRAGNAVARYFPDLKGGKDNLVLFSFVGFPEIDGLEDEIATVQLELLTDAHLAKGVKDFRIRIGDVNSASDMLPMYNYMQSNKVDVVEMY